MRWLCRVGVHGRWYSDCALFASVERCGHCDRARIPGEEHALDQERRMWSMLSEDDMQKVFQNLKDEPG